MELTVLDDQIAAFEKQSTELEKHHHGKWVIFHDGEFVDAFDTVEAVVGCVKQAQYEPGTYLVRQVGAPKFCMPASAAYRPVNASHI